MKPLYQTACNNQPRKQGNIFQGEPGMSIKRVLSLLLTIVIIKGLLPFRVQAQPAVPAVQAVTVTDLSGSPKTTFSPGDTIRYTVSYAADGFSFLRVRGTVSFTNAPQEKLALQYKTGSGDYTISWDSIVPAQALGTATVTIRYFSLPGGLGTSSATFTVAETVPLPAASYVGTSLCIACHGGFSKDIVDAYNESGHCFALNAAGSTAPVYPGFAPGVPQPPVMFSWPDILYVTGGYGWAAQFVNQDGYIITNGVDSVDSQYNLPERIFKIAGTVCAVRARPDRSQSIYLRSLPRNRLFCRRTPGRQGRNCRDMEGTRGRVRSLSRPRQQPYLESQRVKPPNDPAQACANCHFRDNKEVVEASDGLILSQQQADELKAGVKNYFMCVSCHNPHASARYDQSAQGTAIVQDCTSCHKDKTVGLGMSFLRCVDCHMPYAVKSGAHISYQDPDNLPLHAGDVRSHIFTINPDAASPSEMFSPDGTSIAVGSDGRAKGLTLDFVCLSCHRPGGFAVPPTPMSR